MKWLVAFLVIFCIMLGGSVIGGVALPAAPRADVSVISIVVEASSSDAGSSQRIIAPESMREADAMAAVTREALAIAAWILAVLFMFCVAAYVIYHLHVRKRNM